MCSYANFTYEDKLNVHKKNQQNVVITIPQKTQTDNFTNYLLINGNSGFIDHITGLHIPAMILLEAARQCMLSITERFYINDVNQHHLRFTISEISSTFTQFCLPIETKINSKIIIKKLKSEDFFISEIICDIIQNNKICSQVKINYVCSPENKVLEKEKALCMLNINF